MLYDWVRPQAVIPMHGEMRHLVEHTRFAREQGVKETLVARNGDIVRLAPGPVEIVDEAPAGRLHLDGRLIVTSEQGPAWERRKLSFAGVVAVSLVLDRRGDMVAEPMIEIFGLPAEDADGNSMDDILFDAAEGVLRSLPKAGRRDDDLVAEAVRRAVRKQADLVWGKKPVCRVMLTRV
jgi:ribonuclease J